MGQLRKAKTTIKKDKKKEMHYHEMAAGVKYFVEASKHDSEVQQWRVTIKQKLDEPNAILSMIEKLPLKDLVSLQSAYNGTTNVPKRYEILGEFLYKDIWTKAQVRKELYEEIFGVMTSSVGFIHEQNYAGTFKAQKNTLADHLDQQLKKLSGADKQDKQANLPRSEIVGIGVTSRLSESEEVRVTSRLSESEEVRVTSVARLFCRQTPWATRWRPARRATRWSMPARRRTSAPSGRSPSSR